MFNTIKNRLHKVYTQFTSKAQALFTQKQLDGQTLKELEMLLIEADTGIKTTRIIIERLKQKFSQGDMQHGEDLKKALEKELLSLLTSQQETLENDIYLLVGINGSGKTTFAGKLAYALQQQKKKVLLVAADTFRAAATEQLMRWADKIQVDIVTGKQDQDPAAVIFAGCQQYKNKQYDALIIDTAGRLQTKVNLMKQLEKIKRVITKQLPDKQINTLLTIDSMLGQNSFEQAKIFNESIDISGIVLTKMDGTSKGGIVFAIMQELGIPINYITFGEQLDQLEMFNAQKYITQLVNAS